MLKELYRYSSQKVARAEYELYVRSQALEGAPLKAPVRAVFAHMASGIQYIVYGFLLFAVKFFVLIFKSPVEGYQLMVEPKTEPLSYAEYKRLHKATRRFSLWTSGAVVAAVVTVSLVLNLIIPAALPSLGATYTFNQTGWSGGATANNATHPTNQSSWNQYSSKSAEIITSSGGDDLVIASSTTSVLKTSGADFTGGTFSNATTTNSDTSIELSKAAHVNEYTIGALSNIAVTVSAVATSTNGTWEVTFSGSPNIARIFKNDKFVDAGGRAWKVLSVSDIVDKIVAVDSENNRTTPATGAGTVGRWYASILAWEAGREGNLITRNAIERGLPYYDVAADTNQVTIDGWETDATRYIEIYVPIGERHRGAWSTSKYRMEVSNQTALGIMEDYVRIEGLQIQLTTSGSNNRGIYMPGPFGASTDIRVSNNIIRGVLSGTTSGIHGIQPAATGTFKVWNNIVYDFINGADVVYGIRLTGGTLYAYNNVVYNSNIGFNVGASVTYVAKNNIAQNCANGYNGTFDAASNYNISDLASDAPGANSKNSTTVTFVDATNRDFHLQFNDTAAKDSGVDLSADANLAFSTDIDGDTRSGTWDIGVDDVGAVLVMTHSIGTAGRDFPTMQAWEDARDDLSLVTRKVFKIASQTLAFAEYETVTGGSSGATGFYSKERATPSASETYMTLGGVTGTFQVGETLTGQTSTASATLSAILTTAGVIEKGEVYNDSVYNARVVIDGGTTDATHYKWLTAEPGSRHDGTYSNKGARIEVSFESTSGVIESISNYTRVEWLSVKVTGDNWHGLNLTGSNSLGSNMVLYAPTGVAGTNRGFNGINNSIIRNSIIYGAGWDIGVSGTTGITADNITVYDVNAHGFTDGSLVRNSIALSSNPDFGTMDAASSNSISTDATASGSGSLASQTIAAVKFVSTTTGFEDLHIMDGSIAKDAGTSLAGSFTGDVDNQTRAGTWDIGADEWQASSPVYNPTGTFESPTVDMGATANVTTANINETLIAGGIGKSVGANGFGQLGNETTATTSVAVTIPRFSNIVGVDGGYQHSLALLADGTVKAWGSNSNGQLGDGTTVNKIIPVTVSGITNAIAVATEYYHSLALLADGTVKAWGSNSYGQLGDGTDIDRSTPVSVSGITNAVAIAAGRLHSLALLADGTVKAWGNNSNGRLGDGTTIDRTTPVTVSGITNAVAIGAGNQHSLALLADGTMKAWGYNGSGGLGDGTTVDRLTSVAVSGITNAVAIAGGYQHSLALLTDGTVKAWGYNSYGQLGDGTTVDRLTSVFVSGITNAVALDARNHSLALLADGTVKAWGYNGSGGLGDGTTTNRTTPITVSGVANAIAVTAGSDHSMVITGGIRAEVASKVSDSGWQASDYKPLSARGGASLKTLVYPPGITANRYVRYKFYLTTADPAFSPRLDDVTTNYYYYATTSPSLTSSAYNTVDATNILGKIAWTATTPSGTEVRMQVRSAPNAGGVPGTWSSWCGETACDDADYFAAADNNVDVSSAHPLKNGGNDQWLQYKAIFVSTGAATPTLGDVTTTYVVNAPPDFDASYGGGTGVSVAQNTSDGQVVINYRVRDVDTSTGTVTPGYVTPSFAYSLDNSTFVNITSSYLAAGDLTNKAVQGGSYTQYSATWNAKGQINGTYDGTVYIRVTATDNEGANNSASTVSGAFSLDVTNPAATVTVNGTASGQSGAISITSSDDSSYQMMASNNSDFSADGLNGTSGQWVTPASSLTWTFASSEPVRVYIRFRDSYQNETSLTPDAPNTPTTVTIQDTSNLNLSEFREFVSWNVSVAGDFGSYRAYRSTNGTSYSLLATINSASTNFLTDGTSGSWLSNGTTYYYKLTAQDASGNVSRYSSVVSDIPDGQGGTDVTSPTITSVAVSGISTSQATVTWTTDELSNSNVTYSTNTSYNTSATSTSMVSAHSVTLTNLTPNTTYNIRARSVDPLSNSAQVDAASPGTNTVGNFSFTTAQGAVISSVSAIAVSGNSATIVWNTNQDSDSYVVFSSNADLSGSQTTGSATLVGGAGPVYEHRVTLTGLSTNLQYYYKIRSTNGSGNLAEDTNGGSYYTFTTVNDVTAPTISSVASSLASQTSAVITWLTNELADSQVSYGTSAGNLTLQTSVNATMTINHSVVISNLTAGTTYYYRVISADPQGNSTTSSEYSFGTTAQEFIAITRYVTSDATLTDRTPPTATSIGVTKITDASAEVTWNTDEDASSFVSFGRTELLSSTLGRFENLRSHTVTVDGLLPNTTYFFKVKSHDASGNLGESALSRFTTLARSTVVDAVAKKAEETKDVAALTEEVERLLADLEVKVSPPQITGVEPKISVTSSFAEIAWVTDRQSNSIIAYAEEKDYLPSASEPYAATSGNPDERVTEHRVTLSNLNPGTLYHFQVRSKGVVGGVGRSADLTFRTRDEAGISEIEVRDITKETATVFWKTNVSSTTRLEYGLSTDYTASESDASLNTSHLIIVKGLLPGTFYHYRVGGVDQQGRQFFSPDLTFTTQSLPSVLDVKIDSVKEQEMTVRWFTTVLSDSTVEYTNGKTSKTESIGERALVKNHALTVKGLDQDTPYTFRVISRDESGSEVTSSSYNLQTLKDIDMPLITTIQNQSAVSGKDRVQTIVSWKTSEPASSRVYWQEGVVQRPELERATLLDSELTVNHTIVFTGFKPGTAYRLRVESIDASGNVATSRYFTILTPQQRETVLDLLIKNFQDVFNWTDRVF